MFFDTDIQPGRNLAPDFGRSDPGMSDQTLSDGCQIDRQHIHAFAHAGLADDLFCRQALHSLYFQTVGVKIVTLSDDIVN